jgi:hypothetical protein
MNTTPQPESEVAAGWDDTLVAIVGCQIQRLGFAACWHGKNHEDLSSRPCPFQPTVRTHANFTGRRQHFL